MSRRIARLRCLSRAQWAIAIASALLLPVTQIGLRLVGFNRTAGLLARLSTRPPRPADRAYVTAAADAVALVAGRPVLGARCLGRSLVLWFLLRRRGIDAELVVGAHPPGDGTLDAHAWVEVDGIPANDAPDVRDRFGSFGLRLPRLADHHGA